MDHDLSRRVVLAAGMTALAPAWAMAAPKIPAAGRLAFAVFRNGARIGDHRMRFARDGDLLTVTTEVAMTVRMGPVPVYRYSHHAVERWRGDRFERLETTTDGNGRKKQVTAQRTDAGVLITVGKTRLTAGPQTAPLTHWNAEVLSRPLFNPQEGKLVKVTARRGVEALKLADGATIQATKVSLRGEVEIDDFYDAAGAWVALRGKLEDGSRVEYRRV
jgi:hypothetical protein